MYLGLSVLLGFGAGYFATAVLPCQWFGSNFEGACGYGALWAAIGIGVVVAAVSFSYFSFRVVRALPLTQEGASPLKGPLVWVWGSSLLAVLAASILPIAHLGNMVDIPAFFLALGFFISASMVFARRLQMNGTYFVQAA